MLCTCYDLVNWAEDFYRWLDNVFFLNLRKGVKFLSLAQKRNTYHEKNEKKLKSTQAQERQLKVDFCYEKWVSAAIFSRNAGNSC